MLCNVIMSIDVTISLFNGSFVQHNFPLFLEHRGGNGSNNSGGGGMALMSTIIGFISQKYEISSFCWRRAENFAIS
uniref:13.5 kDa protein n=1 Tax=Psittacine adenovirus 5 TaxID=2499624 RepID=A0A5J6DDF2_9ADEN